MTVVVPGGHGVYVVIPALSTYVPRGAMSHGANPVFEYSPGPQSSGTKKSRSLFKNIFVAWKTVGVWDAAPPPMNMKGDFVVQFSRLFLYWSNNTGMFCLCSSFIAVFWTSWYEVYKNWAKTDIDAMIHRDRCKDI